MVGVMIDGMIRMLVDVCVYLDTFLYLGNFEPGKFESDKDRIACICPRGICASYTGGTI